MSSSRHRWGEKVEFGLYKSERQCARCGLVKVTRHEFDGRDLHWIEWWRDEERLAGDLTPVCDARLEVVA